MYLGVAQRTSALRLHKLMEQLKSKTPLLARRKRHTLSKSVMISSGTIALSSLWSPPPTIGMSCWTSDYAGTGQCAEKFSYQDWTSLFRVWCVVLLSVWGMFSRAFSIFTGLLGGVSWVHGEEGVIYCIRTLWGSVDLRAHHAFRVQINFQYNTVLALQSLGALDANEETTLSIDTHSILLTACKEQ